MMIGRMMEGYSGNWDNAPDYMKQMMQRYYGGIKPFGTFIGLMEFIIWILVVVLLVTLIRYFWNKTK